MMKARQPPSPLWGEGQGEGGASRRSPPHPARCAALSPMGRGLFIALLLALLLPLAACGKKGSLDPPPGEQNTYPRTYPSE